MTSYSADKGSMKIDIHINDSYCKVYFFNGSKYAAGKYSISKLTPVELEFSCIDCKSSFCSELNLEENKFYKYYLNYFILMYKAEIDNA